MRTNVKGRLRGSASLAVAVTAAALSIAVAVPASATETTPEATATPTPSVSVEPTPGSEPTIPKPQKAPKPPKGDPAPVPGDDTTNNPEVDPKPTAGPTDEPAGPTEVRGRVWNDLNANGIQEPGEGGVFGVTVFLITEPGQDEGVRRKLAGKALDEDAEEPEGDQTKTGGNGEYVFKDVPAGPVQIGVVGLTENPPQLLRFSAAGQGSDRALDSDVTELRDEEGEPQYAAISASHKVVEGKQLILDAGTYVDKLPTVTVTGRVWDDQNKNGVQDAGEKGIVDVPVQAGMRPAGDFCALLKSDEDAIEDEKPTAKKLAEEDGDVQPFDLALTDENGDYTLHITARRFGVEIVPGVLVFKDGEPVLTDLRGLSKPGEGTDRATDSDFTPCGPVEDFDETLPVVGLYSGETLKDLTLDLDGGLTKAISASPAPGGGGGPLPNTGLAIGGFLIAGFALIGGGTALTIAARRRRNVVA